MSHRTPAVLFSFVLLTTSATAQFGGSAGGLLARAADADGSGSVTAAEWKAFVTSIPVRGDGQIDRELLMARLQLRTLDRNGDGVVKTLDLDRVFVARDANKNAVLEASETAGRLPLMERILFGSADTDGSGKIEAVEWTKFLAASKAKDGVPASVAAQWIAKATAKVSDADRTAMTPGVILGTMNAGLDADKDGSVRPNDLAALFQGLDADGDGRLVGDEMRGRRRGARRNPGAARAARGPISQQDRDKPCLMPWQRTLDDALALQKRTGKPLLICVNMDNESACEQFAWRYYREAAFAKLAEGFIPLIVSPDRHNQVDYDDRGRRLVEPKYGRVTNYEHMVIDQQVHPRFIKGQRYAPRHVGVDKDGKVLFDIYLTNDLESVRRAMQKHAVAAGSTRSKERTMSALLRSYDAADRALLEAMFVKGDAATRLQLTGLALSSSRKTQHPDVLRLALHDPEASVRARAVRAVVENLDRAGPAFLARAQLLGFGDAAVTDALITALQRRATGNADAAIKVDAAKQVCVLSGLATTSLLIDAARWTRQLEGVRAVVEPAPTAADWDAINRRLDELEKLVRARPQDRGLRIDQAATTLKAVRVRLAQGKDPTFLLQDVRGSAAKATSADRPNSLALAYVAVACHLLDETDTMDHAARALTALAGDPDRAATPIAAEVLDLFAKRRTRDVYNAITAKQAYPASWIADIRAAYDVLLAHPAGTEAQAMAFLDFSENVGAPGLTATVIERAVHRHWASTEMHKRFRGLFLTQLGGARLEQGYDRLVATPGGAATKLWYAGLASLLAAERAATQGDPQAARASYAKSIARFEASKQRDPNFADSANHYLCLDHGGLAKLQLEGAELDAALASVRNAIAVRPASLRSKDGRGNTPYETGNAVVRALRTVDRGDEARKLRAALRGAGR